MSIDKRLEEARRAYRGAYRAASWSAYGAASRAAYWAASWIVSETASRATYGTSYWASQYEECSYEVQVEILKGLLDDYR